MMKQEFDLSYKDAQTAMMTIQTEALKRNKAVAIAVADTHGELIAFLRLDACPLPSILIAQNKAFTAAREAKPTRDIGIKSRDPQHAFDISYYGDMRYLGWAGGMPVIIDGKVAGSVAVSGLSGAEDMELAQMGVDVILNENKK